MVLVGFTLASLCRAEPVTLHLRNGDRLTGELITLSTTNVAITNRFLGRVSFPISEVDRLVKGPPVTVAPSAPTNQPTSSTPAPVAAPPAAAPKPGEAAVKTATTPKPPVQPAPKAPKRWNLDAQFGVDLQYNQSHRQLYYGRSKWTYGKDRFRSVVDYLANYGKTDGVLSANDMTGSVRLELDLAKAKKLYVYNAAGAGYNEVRKIDFTYDESVGAGYKLIEVTNFVYSMDLGVNHQEQFFSDGTSKDYQSVRLGEQLTWKISTKLSLDQKFEYYQRFTGWEDYRMRFEANLRYLVLPNITFNLTAIDLYDTQPAPGVTQNDLLLRATVGLKF